MNVSVQTPAGSFPVGSTGPDGQPGTPGINSGRFPGGQQGDSDSRDSSTADLNNGSGGNSGSTYDTLGGSGGDYTLDSLPGGASSGDGDGANGTEPGQPGAPGGRTGAMTASERNGQRDDALRRGYEVFDGFILDERARAQAESNAAGSSPIGEQGQQQGGSGSATAANQPQTLPGESGGTPSGIVSASPRVASAPEQNQTFPPPEDIPSGRDDDVVARQIREAAMKEPDPELREALWEEYRNYTGLSGNGQ